MNTLLLLIIGMILGVIIKGLYEELEFYVWRRRCKKDMEEMLANPLDVKDFPKEELTSIYEKPRLCTDRIEKQLNIMETKILDYDDSAISMIYDQSAKIKKLLK